MFFLNEKQNHQKEKSGYEVYVQCSADLTCNRKKKYVRDVRLTYLTIPLWIFNKFVKGKWFDALINYDENYVTFQI